MKKNKIEREVKIECLIACRMCDQIEWGALRFVLVVITFLFSILSWVVSSLDFAHSTRSSLKDKLSIWHFTIDWKCREL